METCCRILRIEYRDKLEQIGGKSVEGGRGDPVKTIKTIRSILEKLRDKMDYYRSEAQPNYTEL